MELSCKVQNYDWGKRGSQSTVAKLQKSSNPDFEINEAQPYAELWMGTHVNAPSVIKSTQKPLSELLQEHPEYLGETVREVFGELPFLFKVLSVEKALSIQAHPSKIKMAVENIKLESSALLKYILRSSLQNLILQVASIPNKFLLSQLKKHAEELHALRPDIYKDPNHKPEMAIALTPFEALCGFRPLDEIKAFIKALPELQKLIGNVNDGELIEKSFRAILTAPKDHIKGAVDGILQKLETMESNQKHYLHEALIKKLHSEFPYDNGILMVYFLNYLKLAPSDAIFLGANEPHAYLSGDCIECMACSDNVVRAGLTPKFIDIDTLCSMLNYQGTKSNEKLFRPLIESGNCRVFRPPVPDFAVVEIKIAGTEDVFELKPRTSASILLVVSGCGNYTGGGFAPGNVIFVPANETLSFEGVNGNLLLYQALANV